MSARAVVMIYDDGNKRWVPSGSSAGLAKVHIYHHSVNNTFRVVGRKLPDHEVLCRRFSEISVFTYYLLILYRHFMFAHAFVLCIASLIFGWYENSELSLVFMSFFCCRKDLTEIMKKTGFATEIGNQLLNEVLKQEEYLLVTEICW